MSFHLVLACEYHRDLSSGIAVRGSAMPARVQCMNKDSMAMKHQTPHHARVLYNGATAEKLRIAGVVFC